MSRTLELGRAVLADPSAHLQLWLDTSITVSPQQSTNVQRMSRAEFIEFLASERSWVCRGHGLHVLLEVTFDREPIGQVEAKQLAYKIIASPVWSQLNLQTTMPDLDYASGVQANRTGSIQINLAHAIEHAPESLNKRHRLFPNVPPADIRPPKDVPVFSLDIVRFRMDIVPTRTRFHLSKRPLRLTNTVQGGICHANSLSPQEFDLLDDSDILFEGVVPVEGLSAKHQTTNAPTSGPDTDDHNRNYCFTNLNACNDVVAPFDQSSKTRYSRCTNSKTTPTASIQKSASEIESVNVDRLIESALRIVICKGTPKLATGVKVTTSTFTENLSAIAPSLWLPGYLTALAQRAHLIPTISRSLGQAAVLATQSPTLQTKMANLAASATNDHFQIDSNRSLDQLQDRDLEAMLWSSAQSQLMYAGKGTLRPILVSPMQPPEPMEEVESLFSLARDCRSGSVMPLDLQHSGSMTELQDTYSANHPRSCIQSVFGDCKQSDSGRGEKSIQDDLLFGTDSVKTICTDIADGESVLVPTNDTVTSMDDLLFPWAQTPFCTKDKAATSTVDK